jgi:hypothetical protein
MGGILQYLVGVPAGGFILIWGLRGAWAAFTNTAEEDDDNGFGSGIAYLFAAAFSVGVLWAILIEGLKY